MTSWTFKANLITPFLVFLIIVSCSPGGNQTAANGEVSADSRELDRVSALNILQSSIGEGLQTSFVLIDAHYCVYSSGRCSGGRTAQNLEIIARHGHENGYWDLEFPRNIVDGSTMMVIRNPRFEAGQIRQGPMMPQTNAYNRPMRSTAEVALYIYRVGEVTGIRIVNGGGGAGENENCDAEVEFRWNREPVGSFGVRYLQEPIEEFRTVCFQLFDDGWRVQDPLARQNQIGEHWWEQDLTTDDSVSVVGNRGMVELPTYVASPFRSALTSFAEQSGLRLATMEDCLHCENDMRRFRHTERYLNERPFYALGDFNSDGEDDLAVIMISQETNENPTEFGEGGVVIFNGPTSANTAPVYTDINQLRRDYLTQMFFQTSDGLLIGAYEAGTPQYIRPTPDGSYDLRWE